MPKIQIVSDLHLEFSYIDIDYSNVDILVLAGDIHSDIGKLKKYILNILKKYPNLDIVIVAGNHESYSKSVYETIEKMDRLINEEINKEIKEKRCHFLENSFVVLKGIKFIGCTLWSNPPKIYWEKIKNDINDFNRIKNHSLVNSVGYFEKSTEYIEKNILENPEGFPVVIVTHFLPSFSSIDSYYIPMDELNHYYATDLDDLILYTNPKLWIHGHTHCNCDYYIGDTRVLCNPRGYSNTYNYHEQNPYFNRKLVINVD